MNIILLSGGSGTRLWPLSNDIRSKQFIHLFKNSDGDYESMVQRVYRQITSVDSEARLTVATSKSQVSAIKNQLEDKVSVCVEPCRRNTFPAILLAALFLKYKKNVSDDECVVVCPVDPYVTDEYYEAIKNLEILVNGSDSNILLLGIEPDTPSDKYGYIIPESKGGISKVREFKEKPDIKTAEEYINRGALWNAGVFAFKLGYVIKKAHEYIDFTDYDDLYSKYDTLTSISFDYAIVEKESNIRVMRFAGDWKDVGTWNMLSEVMSDKAKGNVMMDDTCENTNVVNELDIPILCMGCKDMIVAASSDGILVSDKEQSGYIKNYVEKMTGEARYAEKSWGTYTVIDASSDFLTVKVVLNAGNRMKYHSHERRDEVWTVVSGTGRTIIDDKEETFKPGDVVGVKSGQKHTIIADTDITVIEVQIGKDISKDDKRIWQ